MANGRYERVGRRLVRHGAVIDDYIDTVSLPDGRTEDWDYIDHVGAAAVVAVRDDGKILMVRQWRNPIQDEMLEIPAGKLNYRGEPSIEAAGRELEEETGYKCDHLIPLLQFRSTVAFCGEKIDIFLAQHMSKGEQHLDDDEFLNVEAWDLDQLLDMIYNGTIQDGKTIAGILAYSCRYASK